MTSAQARLEAYLEESPVFKDLRPDERVRAAAMFRVVSLKAGEKLRVGDPDPPQMGMCLAGKVILEASELEGLKPVVTRLRPGDRWGELNLYAELPAQAVIEATQDAEVALLDSPGLKALLDQFPVCVIPVCKSLARETKWKNDLLRDMQEFDGSRLGKTAFSAFVYAQRRRISYRRASVARRATSTLYRRLISDRGDEPAFWVLVGFIISLVLARGVVWAIFKFDLGEQLFNLGDSGGGYNPTHTHHFTYGFWVCIAATVLAFLPRTRSFLKSIALLFGFGLGLIFDEFALLKNLDPNYYDGDTYWAIGILAALLIQLVYFREFVLGILGKATAWVWRSR